MPMLSVQWKNHRIPGGCLGGSSILNLGFNVRTYFAASIQNLSNSQTFSFYLTFPPKYYAGVKISGISEISFVS